MCQEELLENNSSCSLKKKGVKKQVSDNLFKNKAKKHVKLEIHE